MDCVFFVLLKTDRQSRNLEKSNKMEGLVNETEEETIMTFLYLSRLLLHSFSIHNLNTRIRSPLPFSKRQPVRQRQRAFIRQCTCSGLQIFSISLQAYTIKGCTTRFYYVFKRKSWKIETAMGIRESSRHCFKFPNDFLLVIISRNLEFS